MKLQAIKRKQGETFKNARIKAKQIMVEIEEKKEMSRAQKIQKFCQPFAREGDGYKSDRYADDGYLNGGDTEPN